MLQTWPDIVQCWESIVLLTLLEDSAAVVCRKSLTAPACLIVGAGGVKVKKWRVSEVLRLACSLEHTLTRVT